ncbi:DoxX family protein [Bacillaceae bacterium W0354]
MGNLSTLSIIRYLVGFVFIVSGLMKLVGDGLAAYFMTLSLPSPMTIMYVVAIIEVVCGLLIVFNKYVGQAVIPLLGVIIVAILMTKVPVLHNGFIRALFEARLDLVMLVMLLILYSQYGGRWSRR